MAHDPLFEQRIHDVLLTLGVEAEPKKMFGGVAFMVNGNMSVGITNKGFLMVRIDPADHEVALGLPGARPMDFTGKVMKGFLFVEHDAVRTKAGLTSWVKRSLDHVLTMPKKAPGSKAPRKAAGRR